MADPVLVARDGAVATIVLNRPERRNAIDLPMRGRLRDALAELGADPAVRAVVLTGAGTAFCAGVDLAEPGEPVSRGSDATADGSGEARAAGSLPQGAADGPDSGPDAGPRPVAEPLWAFRKPVIAAVNGPAVGGGLELALACDIRIAAAGARFGLPEVRIGSLPGSGGTQRLPRVVGPGRAAWMILTGELIDAAEALRCGLVSEVVPDDKLAAAAADLAGRVAANAPLSLVAAKEALRAAEELGFTAGQAVERALWARLSVTGDRAEGRAAFRERRQPRFTGR